MSKLPIFELFLSVGNLKPKLKWFFKPKLELKFFLLNWAPGAYELLNGWSNTYLNFEMTDGTDIEIQITKLVEGNMEDIKKATVRPVNAAKRCDIQSGRVIVRINKTGLFTVDIDGQMDDKETGKLPDGSIYAG